MYSPNATSTHYINSSTCNNIPYKTVSRPLDSCMIQDDGTSRENTLVVVNNQHNGSSGNVEKNALNFYIVLIFLLAVAGMLI